MLVDVVKAMPTRAQELDTLAAQLNEDIDKIFWKELDPEEGMRMIFHNIETLKACAVERALLARSTTMAPPMKAQKRNCR